MQKIWGEVPDDNTLVIGLIFFFELIISFAQESGGICFTFSFCFFFWFCFVEKKKWIQSSLIKDNFLNMFHGNSQNQWRTDLSDPQNCENPM